MPLQKISFEYDIPDGYRFKRLGRRHDNDEYIGSNGIVHSIVGKCSDDSYDWIIVEKIPDEDHVADAMSYYHPPANPNRRKHADLIHAWAEGAEIQWLDGDNFKDIEEPNFYDDDVYRIKPKTKTVRFRNYLHDDKVFVLKDHEDVPYGFCKWLGDWQEVEIEE